MTAVHEGRKNDLGDVAFPDDFRDFIHALNSCDVEYLLVGGYAVGMYGHVRATMDIDFFYRCTQENVKRLVRAMKAFGVPAELIDPQHLAAEEAVTQFGAPPTRIDLLASLSGVSFEQAEVDAVRVDIAGETLPVIGLEALRANKKASKRRKDLDDLKRLPESRAADASQRVTRRRPPGG